MDQPVKKVTIVGGGTAGWMTAAVLSQWLSKVEVTLIESDEIGIIGVGEATIPHIRNYLALANVDPLKMIAASKATFKLGIQFVDWGAPGESYIHGFGKIGRDMLWLHPHQLWLAARERAPDSVGHFDRYSLNCSASLKNRFAFADKRQPNSPLADLDYARAKLGGSNASRVKSSRSFRTLKPATSSGFAWRMAAKSAANCSSTARACARC